MSQQPGHRFYHEPADTKYRVFFPDTNEEREISRETAVAYWRNMTTRFTQDIRGYQVISGSMDGAPIRLRLPHGIYTYHLESGE